MRKFILFVILLSLLALSLSRSVSETVDKTRETIEEGKDTIKEKIHQGKDYVEERLEEVADTLKEMYHRAVDRGGETIDNVKDVGERVKDKYVPNVDDARRVKDKAAEGASNLYERGKEKLEETYEGIKSRIEDVKEEGLDMINRGKENLVNVKEGIKAKTEDLIEGTKEAIHRGAEKLGDVKDTIAEKIHLGKRKVEDIAENTKENIDEWTQDAIERYYQAQEGVKDAIKGTINTGKEKVQDVASAGRGKIESLIEVGLEKLHYVKDKVKEGLHIGKNIKDEAKDTVEKYSDNFSDLFENSMKRAKIFGEKGKRKFSKGNENLKDLYDQLWLKLDMWYRTGKLDFSDFKDFFGDKYQDFVDFMSEKAKDVVGDKVDLNPDRFRDLFETVWDKVEGMINKGSLKVDDLKDFLGEKFDVDYIRNLADNPEIFSKEIGRMKGRISDFISNKLPNLGDYKDKLSDIYEDSKERAKHFADLGKRKFSGNENLKDLYDQLWYKLDMWYRTGKMNFEDFKDLFGDKFEEFSDLISEKATQAKDKTKEVFHQGKRKVERAPDRFRDLFEVGWDYLESMLNKGSLKVDDLKDFLGDKLDVDYIKKLTSNPDMFDKEIDRMKVRISEFLNMNQPHMHEHRGFWESLKQTIINWKNLAADKLTRTPPKDNVRIKTDTEDRDRGSTSTEL